IVLTARHTAADDPTMNILLDNNTSTGITTATTSANTTPGSNTLPGQPPFACLDPRPFLEYTDDVGLRDLAQDCKWRSWAVSISNNHNQVNRCGGDPKQKRGDYTITTPGPGVAAYANKSVRGVRTVSAEILYLVSNRVLEWEKMCDSIQLTNVKFGAR